MTSQEIAAAYGVTVEAWEALDERAILEGLPREMWNRAVQAGARYAQEVNRLVDMTNHTGVFWPDANPLREEH